jgi:protein-disulfide isomerase
VRGLRISILLILAALVATVFAGCGSAGSSTQSSDKQHASRTADSKMRKAEGAESSGQASEKRLEHPALGPADAPVVLTEYSDYQ